MATIHKMTQRLRPQTASDTRGSLAASPPPAPTASSCRKCGAANAADRKFCAGCGAALWEPCLACGELSRAGEKFCGNCGINLDETLKQKIGWLELIEMRARSLQIDHQHAEAIQMIEGIEADDHPRLRAPMSRIDELLSELKGEMAESKGRRERALEAAQAAIARSDHAEAIRLLEELPESLRSGGVQELLDDARNHVDELTRLATEIREALRGKQYSGLLTKVERLAELRPGHAATGDLIKKLRDYEHKELQERRDQICKLASKKLASHQYDLAVTLLEQLPSSVRNEEFDKLLDFSREAAWLDRDLREAVVRDEHLLPIARRLLKVKPDDSHARTVLADLESRQPSPGGSVAGIADRSARSEKTSVFGCPLLAWEGLGRIDSSEELRSAAAFVKHRGNYAVACGLALEGLGRATVQVNLRPAEKGLVKKLLSGATRKRTMKRVWGLDLGRTALKAARLSLEGEDRIVCEAVDHVEYTASLGQPDVDSNAILTEAITTFRDRNQPGDIGMCVGMPGQELFTRFFRTPPVERKRLEDLVSFEARNQIPFAMDQFIWDYHVLGDDASREAEIGEYDIAVLAIKNTHVERRMALFAEMDLKVELIQGDAIALYNFLVHDRLSAGDAKELQQPSPRTIAALDLGGDSANLIIGGTDFLWLRNIPFGGGDFTEAILGDLKLTHAQAEAVKRNPSSASRLYKLYQAIGPVEDQLIQHVDHTLRCFGNIHPDRKIDRMYALGDGFKLHNLLKHLRVRA